MKNIQKLQIIILSFLIGNYLNGMEINSSKSKINSNIESTNTFFHDHFTNIKPYSFKYFINLFKEFKLEMPINQAFNKFFYLGLRGKYMFDAHKRAMDYILSNDKDVLQYIDMKKIDLSKIVTKLKEEDIYDLKIIYNKLEESIQPLFILQQKALNSVLGEILATNSFNSWKDMKQYLPKKVQMIFRPMNITMENLKAYPEINKFESENFKINVNKIHPSKAFKEFLKQNIYWHPAYSPHWSVIERIYALDLPGYKYDDKIYSNSSDNIFKVHLQIKPKYLYDFIKNFLNDFSYPQGSFCQMNIAGIKAPPRINIISNNRSVITFANLKKYFFEKHPKLSVSHKINNDTLQEFIDNIYGKSFYEKQKFANRLNSKALFDNSFYKHHIMDKLPTIVIYISKSPKFIYDDNNLRQTYLNSFIVPISKWVNNWAENKNLSLSDIALQVTPRYNLKINDIVYIAGGNGDDKDNSNLFIGDSYNPFDDKYLFIKDRAYKKNFIPKFDDNFIELRNKEANDLIRCFKSKNFEEISKYGRSDTFHKKLFLELISELKNIDHNFKEYYKSPELFLGKTSQSMPNPIYNISSLFRSFLVFYNGSEKAKLISCFYDFRNPLYEQYKK